MKNNKKVRIGCASAFWGDTSTAARQLVEKGDLDYLVFDFLAEVTMSILARAKLKDSGKGFAGDFLTQVEPLLPTIKQKGIKILTNAGGINPTSCRTMLEKAARKEGIDLKIGIVTGDDLIPELSKIEKFGITEYKKMKSSLKFCVIATGEYDFYVAEPRASEWDIAAGHAILSHAGGKVTDFNDQEIKYGKKDFRNPSLILKSKHIS